MHSRFESLPSVGRSTPIQAVQEQEPYLTAPDVADRLSVPVSWVYEKAGLGIIPSIKIGAYRRFKWTQVVAWLEEVNA